MEQYKKSDNVMEAGDHFKNGASPKSRMSKPHPSPPPKGGSFPPTGGMKGGFKKIVSTALKGA